MSGPSSTSTPAPTTRPAAFTVASVLCWLAGLATFVLSISTGIPTISTVADVILVAVNVAAGAVVCVAGVLVYRQRKIGALLVALGWAFPQAADLLAGQPVRPGPVLLFLAMLLTFLNWKYMR